LVIRHGLRDFFPIGLAGRGRRIRSGHGGKKDDGQEQRAEAADKFHGKGSSYFRKSLAWPAPNVTEIFFHPFSNRFALSFSSARTGSLSPSTRHQAVVSTPEIPA
jgi:hypothetical protein